jgi:RNA polymerase sigma-70 factor (ECF subfamily)
MSMNPHLTKRRNFEAEALPRLGDLYRTASYILDNQADAQKLVLETFVKAYHSWSDCQFCPDSRVWLFELLANGLLRKHRASARNSREIHKYDEIDILSAHTRFLTQGSDDGFDAIPLFAISEVEISNVVRSLPEDFRLIVVLSLLEGFSYREIAEIANISVESVRSKLHRGRTLMQRELMNRLACDVGFQKSTGRVRSRRMA